MLKKITKFWINLILFSLFLFFLFSPFEQVHAVFGIGDVGVFDLAQTQLDALDFVDNVVLRVFLFLALLLFESQVFLYLSASLLQWVIKFPINLHNDLVLSGWHFVMGLTNLFLILIFVVIAITYILKIETFQAKKALPRLIIVALLLNFSLVIIGVFADIAQITLKSIIEALGSDLPSSAIAPLTSNIWNLVQGYLTVFLSYITVALVPYANVGASYAILVAAIAAEAFFGTFSLSILLIIVGFAMGIMFLTYFVIFLLRIGIIWILSILSPLAFLCMILPQTRKYWDEWLHTLIEWLTFGIFILLLAGLGLKLFASATIVTGTGPIEIGNFGYFPAFTYNYLFLLIYLGVTIYLSKKYTPQMATVLMNQAQTLGRGARRLATTETLRRDLWGPAAEKTAKVFAGAAKKLEPLGKLSYQFRGRTVTPFAWTVRAVQAPVGPLTEYAAKQRRVTLPAGWKQMSITEKEMYVNSLRRDSDKLVLASEMKDEGTFQKATPDFRTAIGKIAEKFSEDPHLKDVYRKEIGDIFDALPDKIDKKIYLNLTPEVDRPELEKDIKDIVREIKEITGKEITEDQAASILYIRRMKVADLADVTKKSLTSETGRLATIGMTERQVQKIHDTFGRDVIDKLLNESGGLNAILKGKTPEEGRKILEKIYKENPRIVRFFALTPAGRAMGWEGLKYMRDPLDQPTTNFNAFERRMRIQEILEKEVDLAKFYELWTRIERVRRKLTEERVKPIEKRVPEEEIRKLEEELRKAEEEAEKEKARIERHPEEKTKWEEIERLRKPPRRR